MGQLERAYVFIQASLVQWAQPIISLLDLKLCHFGQKKRSLASSVRIASGMTNDPERQRLNGGTGVKAD